jgi:transcriptional regulator with XRE-family HTH domain
MKNTDLKERREKLKLTQEQLAKELKVAANTVSRWELGTRKIPEFLDLALQTIERNLSMQT